MRYSWRNLALYLYLAYNACHMCSKSHFRKLPATVIALGNRYGRNKSVISHTAPFYNRNKWIYAPGAFAAIFPRFRRPLLLLRFLTAIEKEEEVSRNLPFSSYRVVRYTVSEIKEGEEIKIKVERYNATQQVYSSILVSVLCAIRTYSTVQYCGDQNLKWGFH